MPRPTALRARSLCVAFALLGSTSSAMANEYWLIFGTGDTPNRDLFYANVQSIGRVSGNNAAQTLEVVQLFENPDMPQVVDYQLEYQCGKQQVRVASAVAVMHSGARSPMQPPTDWRPLPQSWIQRGYEFLCAPQQRETNAMLKMPTMDLPTLIAVTQQAMFKQIQPNTRIQPLEQDTSTDRVMRDLDTLLGKPGKP